MKNIQNIFLTTGLLMVLSACAVGPDYEKPETKLPQEWQSAPGAQMSDESIIEQNWWHRFNDPTLDQFIARAADGNLDLKIAEARIAQSRAGRASAGWNFAPQGDFKASGVRQANQIAFPGGGADFGDALKKPFNTYQTGFDASWELDVFGKNRREYESAEAEVEASQASRDNVRVSILAEVARTYVDIRQYEGQLALAEDTIKSNENGAGIARQRFNAGDAPRVDLTQAEAQLQQSQAQIPYYRNLLAQSQYAMDVLMGEQPGITKTMLGGIKPVPVPDKALILAAPASVIANRPDIRMAERNLAAATAQQGVAVAQFFPDISLSGFIGLLNTSFGDLFLAGSKSWMASGSVLLPILSYGKLSANMDLADAKQQEALASYQKTLITALSEVERAVTGYTEQQKFREATARAADSNRHSLEIASARYKEGLTSFLEVLDAERALYSSENQLAQAKAQESQYLIAVYKSLGGGWKDK